MEPIQIPMRPMVVQPPHRYRNAVRCIAVTDTCIALFMLTIFGLKFYSQATRALEFPPQALVFVSVYVLQFVMAQVLFTATWHTDPTIILARCHKWYWTSVLLYFALGMEFFFVFWFRGPYTLVLGKLIFRAIANHLVNLFMVNIRANANILPFDVGRIGHPFVPQPPPGSFPAGPLLPGAGFYDLPPTYEESIKDKNLSQEPPQIASSNSQSTTANVLPATIQTQQQNLPTPAQPGAS